MGDASSLLYFGNIVALGADQGRVLRLVLRQGLVLAGIGVAIGVVLAALSHRSWRACSTGCAVSIP